VACQRVRAAPAHLRFRDRVSAPSRAVAGSFEASRSQSASTKPRLQVLVDQSASRGASSGSIPRGPVNARLSVDWQAACPRPASIDPVHFRMNPAVCSGAFKAHKRDHCICSDLWRCYTRCRHRAGKVTAPDDRSVLPPTGWHRRSARCDRWSGLCELSEDGVASHHVCEMLVERTSDLECFDGVGPTWWSSAGQYPFVQD
jgi:hypothetical protein